MSNLVNPKEFPPDMSEKEVATVKKFMEDGLPGIAEMKPNQVEAAISMYLEGATYQQISVRLGVKKHLITFLSYKHDFYQMKLSMLESLVRSAREKMEIAEIKGLDFLTDLMGSIESSYREILTRYKLTKDSRVLHSADMENFKIYMKCLEYIQKVKNPEDGKKGSNFGLNLPDGGILRKIDDNTIEVSAPGSQADTVNKKLGEVLSSLSELKKLREQTMEKK